MKVILLQDVAKIGRRGEVVEVPTGYAQNKLIPKSMAKPATPANLKRTHALQAQAVTAQIDTETAFAAMAAQLKDVVITVTAEANEKGHLFQAVKPDDIVTAAAAQHIIVPVDSIALQKPIKDVGVHDVVLNQSAALRATLHLEVIAK